MVGVAVVSGGEAVVAEQPGDGSFDHPAVFAQLLARLDAFARDADGDAAVADPGAEVGVVVGLVGVQLVGFAAALRRPEFSGQRSWG